MPRNKVDKLSPVPYCFFVGVLSQFESLPQLAGIVNE